MKEISQHQPLTMQLDKFHNYTKSPKNYQQTYHQVLGPDPLPTTWMDCHDSLGSPSETLWPAHRKAWETRRASIRFPSRWPPQYGGPKKGATIGDSAVNCVHVNGLISLYTRVVFGIGVGLNTESETHLATLYKASRPRSSWRLLTTLPDMNMYACIQCVFHFPSQNFFKNTRRFC